MNNYRCEACGELILYFEIKNTLETEDNACPFCGSYDIKEIIEWESVREIWI